RPSDFVTSTTTRHAVVWAVGDGADGSAPAKALAARIAADRPARLLYLGDVYDDGSAGDFVDNYRPVYGRLDTRTAPTPGNHDWPQHDEGYDPHWQRVRGRRTPAYYTFGAAGWQLISLNSEIAHDAGSPQLRWLRATLARRRGTCRLAYWHRPRFSAGKHGDQDDTQPLWSALRGRTAIVLTGHDHNMQRLRPIDGITEFVSGAGGWRRRRGAAGRGGRRGGRATPRGKARRGRRRRPASRTASRSRRCAGARRRACRGR